MSYPVTVNLKKQQKKHWKKQLFYVICLQCIYQIPNRIRVPKNPSNGMNILINSSCVNWTKIATFVWLNSFERNILFIQFFIQIFRELLNIVFITIHRIRFSCNHCYWKSVIRKVYSLFILNRECFSVLKYTSAQLIEYVSDMHLKTNIWNHFHKDTYSVIMFIRVMINHCRLRSVMIYFILCSCILSIPIILTYIVIKNDDFYRTNKFTPNSDVSVSNKTTIIYQSVSVIYHIIIFTLIIHNANSKIIDSYEYPI